jgi:hypothetical protein
MTAENRGLSRLILLIAVSVLLAGCPDKAAKQATPQLVQANIGGQNIYIPKAYLNMGYTGVGSESALIQAWYPGDKVVPGDPDDLWWKKQWYNNVRILVSWYPKPTSMDQALDTQLKLLHATTIVGVEYGLVHQTQPPGAMPDDDDLWIDKIPGDTSLFIACDDANLYPAPQCKEYFVSGTYYIQANYNRRLLPHWKSLHDHVLSLLNSFKSPQSASAYFNTVTEQHQQQEENP